MGDSKPTDVAACLNDFLSEMHNLEDGSEYNGVTNSVIVHCFVCDAPARQFLKCIISHAGYNGCERCVQIGKSDGAMTFPNNNAPKRTDADFASMKDADHHKGRSPLASLNIGLVKQFVVDPMHLIYLGVMKKLLHLFLKGPLPTRIGLSSKNQISCALVELSAYITVEFSHKPRSLKD